MAKGKKTGGRDFTAGVSGNPNGRPSLPEEIRLARKLNAQELEVVLTKYLRCSSAFLSQADEDQTLPALDQIAIKIIIKAIDNGDHFRLGFLLDRIVGKVPDRVADADGSSLVQTFIDIIRKANEKPKP